jgi:hypothetical protein
MPRITYRNRRAWVASNDKLSVTVTEEGGHIASILDKASGVNPLWTPPWDSIEPSEYNRARHPGYGDDAEARLLAGIMGHNLCLDLFGGVSPTEAAAGMSVHGESSVDPYQIRDEPDGLLMQAVFPQAQLAFERRIRLAPGSDVVEITETVGNLTGWDRPSAWTQHVTLGPPFIEGGVTEFRASATRSKVIESDFTNGKGLQKTGAIFDWPHCPRKDTGTIDLRVYESAPVSAGYTAHLMDPHREHAFFAGFHPGRKLAFGYVWRRADFPWLGRWEENRARTNTPWLGKTITLGMEFGASPMPETRQQMIERGSLFGVAGYKWIPARGKITAKYCAFARAAGRVPDEVRWDGAGAITW